MIITIKRAGFSCLEEIGGLYDDLCDYLQQNRNYPGWRKGIYPTIADAEQGIRENVLYVAMADNRIVGTVMLRHEPEDGYKNVPWLTESNYEKIYVIYTLAVHPHFLKSGVGEQLLNFAEELARKEGCVSIRLDVVKDNIPAENLYKKYGYQFVGTTSLGYEAYGLPWFNLYEKVL